ncbi:MAG TPA: PepSY domain-containing protein [Pyrinomonadaceae bacterium]|nr:PepSY domain-containing protein [Pyrinomonadaceae bacterium]
MKRFLLLISITTAALTAGAYTTSASTATRQGGEAQEQQKLAREAKVTKEAAQETALKRAPGNVESAELEREHRRLVWSFDIRNSKGTITEVQVSAITGRVVRVEHESKKQEADEKRKEAHEKH